MHLQPHVALPDLDNHAAGSAQLRLLHGFHAVRSTMPSYCVVDFVTASACPSMQQDQGSFGSFNIHRTAPHLAMAFSLANNYGPDMHVRYIAAVSCWPAKKDMLTVTSLSGLDSSA